MYAFLNTLQVMVCHRLVVRQPLVFPQDLRSGVGYIDHPPQHFLLLGQKPRREKKKKGKENLVWTEGEKKKERGITVNQILYHHFLMLIFVYE